MLDSLVSSIENAFVQPSFKRLLYILFLLLIVISSAVVFNETTGYTLYSRVDKRIAALERLQALEEKNIKQSPELGSIYQSILDEMEPKPWQPISLHLSYDPLIKFLSATLVPFVFVLVSLFRWLRGNKEWGQTLAGALLTTVLLGAPAIIIPNWGTAWTNAAAYFMFQIGFLIFVVRYSNPSKQNVQTPQ